MNKGIAGFIVIDNNMLTCYVAEKMLHTIDKEISVQTFLHSYEALEFVKKIPVRSDDLKTIILLDIQMPIMDGFEFVKEFETMPEKHQEQFSIYILSSSTDINDRIHFRNQKSVKRFLSKPLTYNTLNTIMLEKEVQ